MKITAVEAHVCNARMRNWVFVRVRTDEDGLDGWGKRRSSGTHGRSSGQSRISRT